MSPSLSERRPKYGVSTAWMAGWTSISIPAWVAVSAPMLCRYSAMKYEME